MKKILTKTLAVIALITLLINSSALIVISEAINEIKSLTNEKNVEFLAYFKDKDENKVAEIDEEINSQDMKLYLEVSVKNEGYLENGIIELKNSNFIFNTQQEVDGLNKIEENKVTFDYIGVGETKTFELNIESVKDDLFDLNLLSSESEIELKGNYANSKNNKNSITATRNVQWNLTSQYNEENIGLQISNDIITNKILKYNGTDKRIVQMLIQTGLDGEGYPIKNEKLEVNTLKINGKNPEIVNVKPFNTILAINDNITDSDYQYDEENEKVVVNVENKEVDGKVIWNKNEIQKYIVTYIFDTTENIETQTVKATTQVDLYDKNNTVIKAEIEIETNNEEKDNIVSVSIENTENEMYKGKIYSNGEREFTEKIYLNINCLNVIDGADIIDNQEENLYTRSLKINKQNLMDILGENGTLSIIDLENKKLLTQINAKTETDESGNIVLKYDDIKELAIRITEPSKLGNILIENTKVLKETDKQKIKNLTETNYGITVSYFGENHIINENSAETKITLNETETSADLTLNRESINTLQDNDLEVRITLNENSEKSDLYKNPSIELELPEQVENVEVADINKIYADNFEIKSYQLLDNNGRKVLHIKLIGEDTNYPENALNGPTIILNLKLTLNKKATNSVEEVLIRYMNENAKTYIGNNQVGLTKQNINIVSPTEMITTNTIKNLEIDTVGKEDDKEVNVEVSSEEKEFQVQKQIINNTGEETQNVVIIGRLATDTTDSEKNNMEISVSKGIEVTGRTDAQVYYSNNEEVTTDLNNAENEWQKEIKNNKKVKNYMVVLPSVSDKEIVNLTYSEVIPANLEYNQNAIETYKVEYVETATGIKQNIEGTQVKLTTGIGPELKAELGAEVGGEELTDNAEVKNGEVISYKVKVTNNGTETANNVSVKSLVPDGTVFLSLVSDFVYNYDKYYEEKSNVKEYTQIIEKIEVGETREFTYDVRVKNDAEAERIVTNKATISYDDIRKESNELKVKFAKGDIRVTTKCVLNTGTNIAKNDTVKYQMIIENISDKTKNDLKIIEKCSQEYLKLVEVGKQEGNATLRKNKNGDYYIDNLQAGDKIILYALFRVDTIKENKDVKVVTNIKDSDTTYRSNTFSKGVYVSEYAEASLESPTEGEYVKFGDLIEYDLKIKGYNIKDGKQITIKDEIPAGLSLKSVYIGNKEITDYSYSNKTLTFKADIKNDENDIIKIIAVVNKIENLSENKEITNKVTIYLNSEIYSTNSIKNVIQKVDIYDSDNNENNGNNSNNNSNSNGQNGNNNSNDNNQNTIFEIKGTAWLDTNSNGAKDNVEEPLKGIVVRLLNVNTNKIVKDSQGNEKTVITDGSGNYTFTGIEKGEYIVLFAYDNAKYKPTQYKADGVQESKNSDVISNSLTIDGIEKEYAITDKISITDKSIANVNMGLIELKEFDIKLDKYVTKLVVQTSSGTESYEYTDSTLAKAEIHAKKIKGSVVVVEYEIRVTNVGEATGYVKNIVDYMPKDMKFSSDLNTGWYQKGENLYTTSIANKKLQPGESKSIKLILTKSMTESSTGLTNNRAAIVETYNESGLSENANSNIGKADIIISIKTGEVLTYVILTILSISILGLVAFIITKKIIGRNINL